MTMRLVDRLQAARQRQLVGRNQERALFAAALKAPELPFSVLYVYGPGGIGKTTLLGEFARCCREAAITPIALDARDVEPSPEPFLAALRTAMDLSPDASPQQALATLPGRQVVLIDTYEALGALDGWLRDVFLPELPGHALVVLAGRHPPALAWRSDPGWQHLMQVLPLRNLNPDESLAYLRQRAVPAEQHQPVLDFTHGHPLALSLVADTFAQRENVTFQPEAAPDIVKTLLERFVQKVPGPAHRTALEACALVRLTTESLLGEMLAFPDVRELFEWLRDLSFIESGRQGLFPHDLAREALTADLRWRNPDWYAQLHARARRYYSSRLPQAGRQEQQRLILDYVFLHRDNAVVRPYYIWDIAGGLVDIAREGDWPQLLAMVEQHEGLVARKLAAHWFARQPQGVVVLRDERQQPSGFVNLVALHETNEHDRRLDPAVAAVWDYLQGYAPLRAGEQATLFRFWMARDSYQAVSATQSLIFVSAVQHYLTTPTLAYSFFPCADPDFWAPLFAYADLTRIAEADFTVDGRSYGVYGHDWRALPVTAWMALLAERETAGDVELAPAPQPQLTVLSQPDFAAAMRTALRDLGRPAALAENPLLGSRLVVERSSTAAPTVERVAALQSLIRETCEALQNSPRDARLYRVLYHSYLLPAPTQEQAAELLDLPFSTYRRYLKNAVTLLTDLLWQREIQG